MTPSSEFRSVMGHFCSGVTVIAASRPEGPVGLTCQSFFSVSLDPPLVAFSVGRGSTTYPLIRSVGSCSVSVLADHQEPISRAMARSGTDKWAGIAWSPGLVRPHPVLDGAVAAVECDIRAEYEAGDHVLVLADVRHLRAFPGSAPLLFYRGGYVRVAPGT